MTLVTCTVKRVCCMIGIPFELKRVFAFPPFGLYAKRFSFSCLIVTPDTLRPWHAILFMCSLTDKCELDARLDDEDLVGLRHDVEEDLPQNRRRSTLSPKPSSPPPPPHTIFFASIVLPERNFLTLKRGVFLFPHGDDPKHTPRSLLSFSD
jgi:hypothetical protein